MEIYKEVLSSAQVIPRQVAAVLASLIDEPSVDDDTLAALQVVEYLAHPSPSVRFTAVRLIARRQRIETAVPVLAPMLLDPSTKVGKEATHYLGDHVGELPAGALDALDCAETVRERATGLHLRRRLGTWERLRCNLRALHDPAAEVAQSARFARMAGQRRRHGLRAALL